MSCVYLNPVNGITLTMVRDLYLSDDVLNIFAFEYLAIDIMLTAVAGLVLFIVVPNISFFACFQSPAFLSLFFMNLKLL